MTPIQMNGITDKMYSVIRNVTGYTIADLQSPNRCNSLCSVRFIFAHHAKEYGMSMSEIAKCLNRTHASVIHMLSKYDDDYNYSYSFRELANSIGKELNNVEEISRLRRP